MSDSSLEVMKDVKEEVLETPESPEVSNGSDEPMDEDRATPAIDVKKAIESSVKRPGRITSKSRKSSSSVSSEVSASKENGSDVQEQPAKKMKIGSVSDEEDFFGFSSPLDSTARDKFQEFLEKDTGESNDGDEDSRQSEKGSVENVDSDSNTEPVLAPRVSSRHKNAIDNEAYKKPFELGWQRELVYRGSHVESQKRIADVYYIAPNGRKARSLREVMDHLLSGDLTTDNFTFTKEPIGINDPTKEIIREARVTRNTEELSSVQTQSRKSTPIIKSRTKSQEGNGKTTPKAPLKWPTKKSSLAKSKEKSRRTMGPPPDDESSEDTDWDNSQKNPTREVCSIECRLAMGLIPTLQCVSCLCLYHPECVGVQLDKLGSSKSFTCKNCQTMSGQQSKSNNVLPTLLPMSPSSATNTNRKSTLLKINSKTTNAASNRPNIVGTVTTWLPSSTSIQVSQSSPSPKMSTTSTTITTTPTTSTKASTASSEGPHQGLVKIGSNTFVLIPRHNVVNVSNQSTASAVAPTPTTSPINPSQTQTNGILLVPLSVAPPDSALVDVASSVGNSTVSTKTVNPSSIVETNGLKGRSSDSSPEDELPLNKTNVKLKEIPPKYLPNNFFTMSDATTMSMCCFFQYLKVHELLRATQVNKTWQFIATHQSLWETVRMKNSKVRDFEGLANALRKYNTRSLDLRKMLTPESPEATSEMWSNLSSIIGTLPNLRRIDFGRCTPHAIEVVSSAASQLESIISLSIRGNELNMVPLSNCHNLVELKLKSFGGIDIKDIEPLRQLKNLKTLVLTTIKNLEGIETALPDSLENLELGECVKLSEKFASEGLTKMFNLKRLRLEKGQGDGCPTLSLLQTIANLSNLSQLELINFDIKPGFDKALSKCTNIKILLIIPTYVTQSATTNHVVMGGVSKLSASLQYFIWGLTLELLRVTDLFINQVEGGKGKMGGGTGSTTTVKKAGTGDSIPILKPMSDDNVDSNREGSASQVDILGLPKLQRVLSTLLPQTKIKILKIPFSATWRQTVSDVQN